MRKTFNILLLIILSSFFADANAYLIRAFDPGNYPYTDEQLGINGFSIESFEDDTLVDNLSVYFGHYTTEGTHLISSDDLMEDPSLAWDETHLLSHDTNFYSVFFKFDTPIKSFGIGISNAIGDMDIVANNSQLLVNNISSYSSYQAGDNRDVYLTFEVEDGDELISFLRFDGGGYSANYDRLAFSTSGLSSTEVPEPTSILLFSIALIGLTLVARKRIN